VDNNKLGGEKHKSGEHAMSTFLTNLRKVLLLSTIVLLCVKPLSSEEEVMQLVYFDDYAPFSWQEKGQMKGIMIDVLTEALQSRMGIRVSHQGYPWARAQEMVRAGEADAFATVATEERRKYTNISKEAVVNSQVSIFVPVNSQKMKALENVKTISDLKNFKHVQYLGNGWAKHNLKGMTVHWNRDVRSVLKFLTLDRADIFVDDDIPTLWNIKKLGFDGHIIKLPIVLAKDPFRLCIGKKSKFVKILAEFKKTIEQMRKKVFLRKFTINTGKFEGSMSKLCLVMISGG